MNKLTYLFSGNKRLVLLINLAVFTIFMLTVTSCSEDKSESQAQPTAVTKSSDLAVGASMTLTSKASTVHSHQMHITRVSPSSVQVSSAAIPVAPDHRATSYAIDLYPNAAGQLVIPTTGKWWWIPFDPSEPPVQMIKGTVWTVSCECEVGVGTCQFESKTENIYEGACVPNPLGDPGDESPECECCSTTWTRVDYLGTHGPGVIGEAINLTYNGIVYN